jgi:imidazolonepropionase-like amidohydrolase
VLEGAAEAGPLAGSIAEQGVPVVLTGLADAANADADAEQQSRTRAGLAKTLADAGVTVVIASGSGRAARNLPLIAAAAVGHGLPEAVALRALTLSAAEVLGIARTVGSLERNKLGDVLVTSGPLFASDSRVLRVLSAGESVYEAK